MFLTFVGFVALVLLGLWLMWLGLGAIAGALFLQALSGRKLLAVWIFAALASFLGATALYNAVVLVPITLTVIGGL